MNQVIHSGRRGKRKHNIIMHHEILGILENIPWNSNLRILCIKEVGHQTYHLAKSRRFLVLNRIKIKFPSYLLMWRTVPIRWVNQKTIKIVWIQVFKRVQKKNYFHRNLIRWRIPMFLTNLLLFIHFVFLVSHRYFANVYHDGSPVFNLFINPRDPAWSPVRSIKMLLYLSKLTPILNTFVIDHLLNIWIIL